MMTNDFGICGVGGWAWAWGLGLGLGVGGWGLGVVGWHNFPSQCLLNHSLTGYPISLDFLTFPKI